jgi:hypothetical protein
MQYLKKEGLIRKPIEGMNTLPYPFYGGWVAQMVRAADS